MKMMVIDGNSLINRAFYGIRPLTNGEGLHTNAIYGFISIYLKMLEDEKPDGVCVAFDLRAPTFRHKKYDGYKANRKGMPDELAEQMEPLKEVLDAMNIKRIECEGYEADDIIGTISRICAETGNECDIVTGDRDSFQLIENRGTNVLLVTTRMGRTETVRYNSEKIIEKYGIEASLMRDLKALMGDSSDNIPGVAGIGEKTALSLVSRFGDIDNLYENLDSPDIKDSVRKKLTEGRENAYLSKWLGTICLEAPINFTCDDARLIEADREKLYRLFLRLEFKNFINKLGLRGEQSEEIATHSKKNIEQTVLKSSDDVKNVCGKLSGKTVSVVLAEDFAGIGVCDGESTYCMSRNDADENDFDAFCRFVLSDKTAKIMHNIKKEKYSALAEGICLENAVFDTALGAYVADPSKKNYSLDSVAHMFGLEISESAEKLTDASSFSPLTGSEDGLCALSAVSDAIFEMRGAIEDKLERDGGKKLYDDIEMPLVDTLYNMERRGVAVDGTELRRFGENLSSEIARIEDDIYKEVGEKFNILSPKQLGEVLFEHLGIPPVKKTKRGYSTDADVLEKLSRKYSIIRPILEYRKLTKLKSTYTDGLLRFISDTDGRIHTTFNQMATATGRISSTDPNLQNIPVRSELGGEVRKMFGTKGKDYCFVDADYSQIELRVLAHITGDKEMCRAFSEGADIHSRTASQVFGVSQNDVTPEMRRVSKAVNFGIVYGISEFSLADDIGVSRSEAKAYMEAYLKHYSGIAEYMKSIVEKAHRDGYVTTMFGRRRYIPELSSKNYNLRAFGERVALNAPIQGTAADIIKIAMNSAEKNLSESGLDAELILQVHDELIVEARREDAEKAAELLTAAMENACRLSVPLVAEAGIGDTWYDAKK